MANIAVLTSGGVDSSVALYELKEKTSHNITAYYLKIWLEDEMAFLGSCPWEDDLKHVNNLCSQLNIPLEVISLQKDYHDRVVHYVIEELKKGRTPSPDLLCNQFIKFGAFFDKIDQKVDYVATGHYANTLHGPTESKLLVAKDSIKDQTYFLSLMRQTQIQKCLFPLGNYLKSEVRDLARSYGLENADRPDSQGICFLGKIKYDDFVKYHLGERNGPIIDRDTGTVLGEHRGFWFHTTGQRRGLNLSGGPWFVVDKNPVENTVYVRNQKYAADLGSSNFLVSDFNSISSYSNCVPLKAKVRHGPKMYDCTLSKQDQTHYLVTSSEKDKGISPGQFCVFYQGNTCLGGSVIDKIMTSV